MSRYLNEQVLKFSINSCCHIEISNIISKNSEHLIFLISSCLQVCIYFYLSENYLTKINENDVFLNIEDIRRIHLIFWNECVVPLIQTVRIY